MSDSARCTRQESVPVHRTGAASQTPLPQILNSIRRERALIERIDYNILFRWFIGLHMDESVWNHFAFFKSRDRLVESDIAPSFLKSVPAKSGEEGLLSNEHFSSVDGTLLEAWASPKSFRPKDGLLKLLSPKGVAIREWISMGREEPKRPMPQ